MRIMFVILFIKILGHAFILQTFKILISYMTEKTKASLDYNSLGGLFAFYYRPITVSETGEKMSFPQSFFSFPKIMLLTLFISNLLKLAIPFTLQYLYLNISPDNIFEPSMICIVVVLANYYFQLTAEGVMSRHKLTVKQTLCRRVIKTAMMKPYQKFINSGYSSYNTNPKTTWSKITANINIFVNNYYTSYVTLIFQTLKALVIVIYLFNKIGWITAVGLFIGGLTVQFIGFVSKNIQNSNFNKLKAMDKKTKILNEYLTRIVDYQMSWLDGFVGERVQKLENQYLKYLKRTKMLDAWCVGLWQFTQIGISSVVLCLYYFYYDQGKNGANNQPTQIVNKIQPATIIYLFQMLTFPMNAISWHIAGLNNAQRALNQLDQSQRDIQKQRKKIKAIQKLDFGYEISQIEKSVKFSKIYAINSDDTDTFQKLALLMTRNNKKVGYAQQNGFMLPTIIQNLYMTTVQFLQSNQIKKNVDKIASVLSLVKFQQFPMQNLVSTFSGGQKMRLSLARAFMHGKYIIIDSDLTSLDKTTRTKVFKNMRDYVAKNNDVVIIIKGKKGDEQMQKSVNQWVNVQSKFSRVKFEVNKNFRTNLKKSLTQLSSQKPKRGQSRKKQKSKHKQVQKTIVIQKQQIKMQKQEQNEKQLLMLKQKILSQISQFETYQIFHPKQSKQSKLFSSPSLKALKIKMTRKINLTIKTIRFYFYHKFYHILFVLSLASMYCVGNYYNYFVNINKPEDPLNYAYAIMYITLIYIICIILRSYLFAKANILQAERISKLTNKFVVYNHINFYDRFNIVQHDPEEQDDCGDRDSQNQQSLLKKAGSLPNLNADNSPLKNNLLNRHSESIQNYSKTLNTQKLVTLVTSDETTLTNSFPFSTNILWNNIATVIGSFVMIFLQVPQMIVFTLLFVLMIKRLQSRFRKNNQKLVLQSKQQEAKFMKSVNNIEQAALYIDIYNKKQFFYGVFNKQLKQNIQNTNILSRLSIWVQANFRVNMVLFLILSIGLFWVNFVLFRKQQVRDNYVYAYSSSQIKIKQIYSAKMSVMLRYILLLADYIFYLTMSLSECRGQALSIQRIRQFAQNQKVISGSFQRIQRIIRKKQGLIKSLSQNEDTSNKQFINLSNFTYYYNRKQSPIFQSINLKIQSKDRIVLKGKTGAGKTTLFKILMGLYPQAYFPQKTIKYISFSSQHPLKLGDSSILQRVDPYQIMGMVPPFVKNKVMQKVRKILERQQKNTNNPNTSYQEQVLINNLRAYLYGFKGLTIYDEPLFIPDQSDKSTYLIVTHHGKFKSTSQYMLQKGKLIEFTEPQNN